jgi:hypothetical protein
MYEAIQTEQDLDELRRLQREEDLYLEFKQKQDSRNGDLGESDRKNYSKALSGFANADGGLLIWGVETARSQDGIDRAHSLKPFAQAAHFRARLLDSVLNSTQPVVDGIEAKVIEGQAGGYLVCLVPQSVRAPHRAVLAEHQYWRRTATGHRRMDHYELEDLFGRRLRPAVALFLEIRPVQDNPELENVHFFALNEGRGIARHFGFLWRPTDAAIQRVHGHSLTNASTMNNRPTITYYDAHQVLHSNGIYFGPGYATIRRANRNVPLEFSAAWYAEDMETRRGRGKAEPGIRVQVVNAPAA